jgi:chromosome segregation ATPase
MHRFYFLRLGLCDEQGEAPATPSGAAAEEPKLTIGAQIKAAIAAKADLQNQIAAHEATITGHVATIAARDATITGLTAQLDAANAKITTLEADAAEVKSALAAHEAEVAQLKAAEKTAEQKAKEKVAALGFPASKLPAADEKLEPAAARADLVKQLDSTSDPVLRGEIVNKLRALREEQTPAKN